MLGCMGSQRGSGSVTPLSPLDETVPRERESSPPRLLILAIVLIAGTITGWLLAGRGDGGLPGVDGADVPGGTPAARFLSADSAGGLAATVEWAEATAVPAIPPGWELSDHSGFVEAHDAKYMVMQLRSPQGDFVANELWSSDDGMAWTSRPFDLGVPIADPRLVPMRDGYCLRPTPAPVMAYGGQMICGRAPFSHGPEFRCRPLAD